MANTVDDTDDCFDDSDYLPPSSPALVPFRPNLKFESPLVELGDCSSDFEDGELDIERKNTTAVLLST